MAGLVSEQPLESMIEKISELNAAAARLGCKLDAPFMTLSFMSLSPIPELKLTDQGLVDAINLKLTTLVLEYEIRRLDRVSPHRNAAEN